MAGMSAGRQNKKDLNVELNLLPVFDVLSVCICFLLMTVVWTEVRALQTKQAIGGQSISENKNSSSLWITWEGARQLRLTWKLENKQEKQMLLKQNQGQLDLATLTRVLQSKQFPIQTAHLMPTKDSRYNEIIQVMDILKQNEIVDIGVSPI